MIDGPLVVAVQYKVHLVTSNEQNSSGPDKQVILFTAFINDMNKGMECTHRRFVDSKKLETVEETVEETVSIQLDLDSL